MNIVLLIFFAIPLAIIVISISLQRLLKCPSLVASIIFVIAFIIAIVLNDINVIILAIVYALIAYFAALLYCIFCKVLANNDILQSCIRCCPEKNNDDTDDTDDDDDCCCNNTSGVNANVRYANIDSTRNIELISDGTNDYLNQNINNNNYYYTQPRKNFGRRSCVNNRYYRR